MLTMRYAAIYLLLCLCVNCHRVSIEKNIGRLPSSHPTEYHVLLASWYGPSPGAGLSGSVIIEADLERQRFRTLAENSQGGILPHKPPKNAKELQDLIMNVPSQELSQKDCQSLHEVIAAWLATTPPAEYHSEASAIDWLGETVLFVSWGSSTVTVTINSPFDMLRWLADEKRNPPQEFQALLDQFSFLMVIKKQ
jgi:hypothetical protein